MTETTLCGYCFELPEQARRAAHQISRCPLCKTEVGVSGAGKRFRIADDVRQPRRRGPLLIALLLVVTVPAVVAAWWKLSGDSAMPSPAPPALAAPASAPLRPTPPPAPATPEPPADVACAKRYALGVLAPDARYKPDIAASAAPSIAPGVTTATVARPAAALTTPASAPLFSPVAERPDAEQALRKVPEVDLDRFPGARDESREQAKQRIAELVQIVRKADEQQSNGFLRNLIVERADLAGLPFLMGERCQISSTDAAALSIGSSRVRQALTKLHRTARPSAKSASGTPLPDAGIAARTHFWSDLLGWGTNAEINKLRLLPAIVQIVPPEGTELRRGLLDQYQGVAGAKVTKMLARLALYDPDAAIRRQAALALSVRPKDEYTEVLLDGLRYPWLPVAERAANLIVTIPRPDLRPMLIDALDGPDPGAPCEQEIMGKKVLAVRELVRINHHRNCLLCHAPAPEKPSRQMVLGAVPSPSEPLPPSFSVAYNSTRSKQPLVRADITYLRQDFSLMMPVANADPWPRMQRYDFLVRTRELTDAERREFLQRQQAEGPARMSRYRQALLSALRGSAHTDAGTSAASGAQR